MSNINVLYRIKYTDRSSEILTVKKHSLILENQVKTVSNNKTYRQFNNMNIFDANYDNLSIFNNYYKALLEEFITNNIPTFSTLAYGQTGSGKTYTIFGTKENKGLIYHTIELLLNNNIKPDISCLEIYNNNIYDVLSNKDIIYIYDSYNKLKYSKEIKKNNIDSFNTFLSNIQYILSNRHTGTTKLNNSSSRSHLIIKIQFNNKNLYIIDLAGNEKGKYSLATNKNLQYEYIQINKSLFSLKECIRAIAQKHKYIPYRRSTLTLLLKDIFFNNGSIHFIATISPLKEHYHDIIDTIKFAYCLQNNKIIMSIHNSLDNTKLLKEYFDYIIGFNSLMTKDYMLYNKIKKENETDSSKYSHEILSVINNKIKYLKNHIDCFQKYNNNR
jgi:hypothetical protein